MSWRHDGQAFVLQRYPSVADWQSRLVDASSTAAARGEPLFLPAGTYAIDSDATLAASLIFAPGAVLAPASGVTLTLSATIEAAPTVQIFGGSGTVVLSKERHVSANWWGAKGDGATDDRTALFRMRRTLLQNPAEGWHLTFPAGTYRYSRPFWLRGVKRIHVSAYGARFYNSAAEDDPSATAADNITLHTNPGMFQDAYLNNGEDSVTGSTFGHLIDSANAGQNVVTCSTASEAGNYSPGDRVLLYGFCRQDESFPPSPRRFEFGVVDTSDSGTGIIELVDNLREDYRADWWDFNPGKGAARILNLSRAEWEIGEELVWEGGEMLRNPNWAAPSGEDQQGSFRLDGYLRATVSDIKCVSGYQTECGHTAFYDCDLGLWVTDKVLEEATFERCTFRKLTEATGVNRFEVRGGSVDGEVNVSAVSQLWEGVRFNRDAAGSSLVVIAPSISVARAEFRGCRFATQGLNAATSANTGWISAGATRTLTVASVSSNTKILVAVASEADVETIVRALDVGFVLRKQSDPSVFGVVTAIYQEDASNLAIEADFSAVPSPADVMQWSTLRELIVTEDCAEVGRNKIARVASFELAQRLNIRARRGQIQRHVYAFEDLERAASGAAATISGFHVYGKIRRVWVDVIRAYSGADTGLAPVLTIRELDTPAVLQTIDLLTTGERECTAFGTQGAAGDDTLAATTSTHYRQLGIAITRSGGFYPAYTDRSQLPQLVVEIETVSDA